MAWLDTQVVDWMEKNKPNFIYSGNAVIMQYTDEHGVEQKTADSSVRKCVCRSSGLSEQIDLENEVLKLSRENKHVDGIKLIRTKTGMGLKEAKDMADRIRDQGVIIVTPTNAPLRIETAVPMQIDPQGRSYSW